MSVIKQKIVEGTQHYQAGNYRAAQKLYKEALALSPGETEALRLLSLLYSETNESKKAILTISHALKIAPESALLHYTKGNIFLKSQEDTDAKLSYEKAIEINPNFLGPIVNLGVLLRKEGDLTGARKQFNNALRLNAQSNEALAYLGIVICELPIETSLDTEEAKLLLTLVKKTKSRDQRLVSIFGRSSFKIIAVLSLIFKFNKMEAEHLEALHCLSAMSFNKLSELRCVAWANYKLGSHENAAMLLDNYYSIMSKVKFATNVAEKNLYGFQKELPDVSGNWPQTSKRPIIYAAATCDYLSKFAVPLVQSVLQNSNSCDVHMHVLNPRKEDFDPTASLANFPADRVTWTTEELGQRTKAAYAGWRFLRLPDLLLKSNRVVVCLDIDSIVRNDVAAAIESLLPFDALVYDQRNEICVSQLFAAGFVAVAPTTQGRKFAGLVASYIFNFVKEAKEEWFVDQFALLMTADWLREEEKQCNIVSAPHDFLDWDEFADTSLIWTGKGDKKTSIPKY